MYEYKSIRQCDRRTIGINNDNTPLLTVVRRFMCSPISKSRAVLFLISILAPHVFRDSMSLETKGNEMLGKTRYDQILHINKDGNQYYGENNT